MSGELMVKRARKENTLLTAIEACSKHVIDLKVAFNQRFSTLENRIGIMTVQYNKIMQKMDVLEQLMKNSMNCDNHKHSCCDEMLMKMTAVEEMQNSFTCEDHKHSCCEEMLMKINAMEEMQNSFSCQNHRHSCCKEMLLKMNAVEKMIKLIPVLSQVTVTREDEDVSNETLSSPVVLVHNKKPAQVSASVGLDSTVQVITLNCESDYPEGSWLGDETNPESRVRCAITPPNLLHINTFCTSPEKMAVTLLDYLFPREVLAVSNLSGKGKHGKKQLDPLMIYGIRCHLLYKFNISERDWYRIKQNMDSKCRTAWRKKVRGLPLGRFRNTGQNDSPTHQLHQLISEDGESLIVTAGSYVGDDSVEEMEAQVIHTAQGDIKVLHATPEQLVRIQETHHIQVLSEDLILPVLHGHTQILGTEDSEVSAESPLPLSCSEQTLTIVTSSGEVSMDVADIGSHHSHLVEPQDAMQNAEVLPADIEGDMDSPDDVKFDVQILQTSTPPSLIQFSP